MKADFTDYYEFIQNEEINDNLNVINVSRWRHLSELALLVSTIPVGSAQVESISLIIINLFCQIWEEISQYKTWKQLIS